MRFAATVRDHRRLAKRRLPRFLFDYVDGGAGDERTMRANEADFAEVRIRQRVLIDVATADTSTTLAGTPVAMPLALAPVGLAGLFARRGEVQAVRAADAAGVPFTLSTVGICGLDEVRAAARRDFWFQLYMLRDRGAVVALLERAWAVGCRTLVFTVDLPVTGLRHRDTRNGLSHRGAKAALIRTADLLRRPGWIWDVGLRGRPHGFANLAEHVPAARDLDGFKAWIDAQFDPTVTWADIAWLRERWRGRLILKGILDVEDARAAVAVGADGIVVSNHGGRQLDSVASTIATLPAVVAAVGAELDVLLDGGVRSGTDVFKAVALGARGVLVGRPWVWAIAGAGEAGLRDLLATFERELRIAMMLAGVRRIADVGPRHLEAPERPTGAGADGATR